MGVALAAAAGLGERLGMINLPPIKTTSTTNPPTTRKEKKR